jgi:hypothetical protein
MLVSISGDFDDRMEFNQAVGRHFPLLGVGSFRSVYDIGSHVLKLRNVVHDFEMNCGGFSVDDLERSNVLERRGYLRLRRYRGLVRFVLEPLYWRIGCHDVIVMRKVRTLGDGAEWSDVLDSRLMGQLRFIKTYFADTHDGNMGYDDVGVYMIDLNMHWSSYTEECMHESLGVA